MSEGFGFITWWGFSPYLDLMDLNEVNDMKNMNINGDAVEQREVVNILLIGSSDVRHIINTIAKSYKHKKRQLNFYILESRVEIYARQMLLLSIALEPQRRFGLQDKTELFLEIFGNSLIRRQCLDYISKISGQYIKMVTDLDYCSKVFPCIDLSLLKFLERDMMENVFKYWRTECNPRCVTYDADKCWNLRLRNNLGTRYDAVPNIFSWDHSMKLLNKGATVINSREYNQWRQYGVAFGIRDGTYDKSNVTLSNPHVFIRSDGSRTVRIGYWGDIITGPYISFGIECEDKSFLKLANNQHTKTAQDVSEYNVCKIFHELLHGEPYATEPVEPRIIEITEEEVTEVKEEKLEKLEEIEENEENEEKELNVVKEEKVEKEEKEHNTVKEENIEEEANKQKTKDKIDDDKDVEFKSIDVDGANIIFLPILYIREMHKKSKYKHLFQSVFISNSMFHFMNSDLSSTFADGCHVTCETSKFMLALNKEQNETFLERMTDLCTQSGCKLTKPCDSEKDAFAHYEYSIKP